MTIDLSKLSPAYRRSLLTRIQIHADQEYNRMEIELESWSQEDSPARKQMDGWLTAIHDLDYQCAMIKRLEEPERL